MQLNSSTQIRKTLDHREDDDGPFIFLQPPAMELCTSSAAALTSLPLPRIKNHTPTNLRFHTTSPRFFSRSTSGLSCSIKVSVRDGQSEETSSGSTQTYEGKLDGVVTIKDDSTPIKGSILNETMERKISQEDSPADEQALGFDFLNKFDIKLDTEDGPRIIIYGGSALVAVWLASVVVGAIDSIPVFPKLMELVGVAYSIWFGTRYLLFKRNRDELAVKLDELKEQVLGLDKD